MSKRPIQVYLDEGDRKLLDELAERYRLSLAEAVRAAIRRWAAEGRGDSDPVLALIGTIDTEIWPEDLSTRQDEYAVFGYTPPVGRVAEKRRRNSE